MFLCWTLRVLFFALFGGKRLRPVLRRTGLMASIIRHFFCSLFFLLIYLYSYLKRPKSDTKSDDTQRYAAKKKLMSE